MLCERLDYFHIALFGDEQLNPLPLLTGDDLVREGLKPGKDFKRLLDQIRDMQLEGQLTSKEQAIAEAKRLKMAN